MDPDNADLPNSDGAVNGTEDQYLDVPAAQSGPLTTRQVFVNWMLMR